MERNAFICVFLFFVLCGYLALSLFGLYNLESPMVFSIFTVLMLAVNFFTTSLNNRRHSSDKTKTMRTLKWMVKVTYVLLSFPTALFWYEQGNVSLTIFPFALPATLYVLYIIIVRFMDKDE